MPEQSGIKKFSLSGEPWAIWRVATVTKYGMSLPVPVSGYSLSASLPCHRWHLQQTQVPSVAPLHQGPFFQRLRLRPGIGRKADAVLNVQGPVHPARQSGLAQLHERLVGVDQRQPQSVG